MLWKFIMSLWRYVWCKHDWEVREKKMWTLKEDKMVEEHLLHCDRCGWYRTEEGHFCGPFV